MLLRSLVQRKKKKTANKTMIQNNVLDSQALNKSILAINGSCLDI